MYQRKRRESPLPFGYNVIELVKRSDEVTYLCVFYRISDEISGIFLFLSSSRTVRS
jgi:hypothetical protein